LSSSSQLFVIEISHEIDVVAVPNYSLFKSIQYFALLSSFRFTLVQ
jgi:hypothetical protein